MRPSRKHSMISQIVVVVTICVVLMQLYAFFKDGQILELFKSLFDMALWAYLRWSLPVTNNPNEPQSPSA